MRITVPKTIKMLSESLTNYKIILASGSPRRHAFLRDLGIGFEIRIKAVEEVYPDTLKGAEIAEYLSKLKANAQKDNLSSNEILITSDTVVLLGEDCLGKPKNREEAIHMIKGLSGKTHEVVTAVSFTAIDRQITKHCSTTVRLAVMSDAEIDFYVDTYKPYDKAGAYGIQEWLGATKISEIKGSYNNVMGLPTHIVYEVLKKWNAQ